MDIVCIAAHQCRPVTVAANGTYVEDLAGASVHGWAVATDELSRLRLFNATIGMYSSLHPAPWLAMRFRMCGFEHRIGRLVPYYWTWISLRPRSEQATGDGNVV